MKLQTAVAPQQWQQLRLLLYHAGAVFLRYVYCLTALACQVGERSVSSGGTGVSPACGKQSSAGGMELLHGMLCRQSPARVIECTSASQVTRLADQGSPDHVDHVHGWSLLDVRCHDWTLAVAVGKG
jgi:hypothetical protein